MIKKTIALLSVAIFMAAVLNSNVALSAGHEITVPGTACHESTSESNTIYRYYNGNIHNMDGDTDDSFYVVCPISYVMGNSDDGDYAQTYIYVYDPTTTSNVGVDCTFYSTNYSGSQIDYVSASTDTKDSGSFSGWTSIPYQSVDPEAWEFGSVLDLNGGTAGDKVTAYCYLPYKSGSYGGGVGTIFIDITNQ
jgi:hypothetical protein